MGIVQIVLLIQMYALLVIRDIQNLVVTLAALIQIANNVLLIRMYVKYAILGIILILLKFAAL